MVNPSSQLQSEIKTSCAQFVYSQLTIQAATNKYVGFPEKLKKELKINNRPVFSLERHISIAYQPPHQHYTATKVL
jgi:hypothetical protein